MEYWQHHQQYDVTTEEFVNMARRHYGYDVPTFREAIRNLFRSIIRKRIINKQIPDLQSAIEYLEGQEVLSVPRYDQPGEFAWRKYCAGERWMMKTSPDEEE